MKLSMILPAVLLCYACCNLWYTVTFGAIYISTSKSVIEEGDTFEINCTVKPLTNVVQFFLDGTPQGDCTSPIPGIAPGTCSTGITQDIITEETTLTISSASIFTQQGNWKCTHNAEEDDDNIYVFNFITVLTNNQYELPATIETSSSPNSEFKVFVACGYPQPTIAWTLDTCDGSETGIAVNSPTLTTNTSAGCTSPLVAYTSAIKASALASPTVETCYIPKATMMYTEKPSVMSSSPFTSQVQFPGISPESKVNCWADKVYIFLIAFGGSVFVILILWCKGLLDETRKVILTVVLSVMHDLVLAFACYNLCVPGITKLLYGLFLFYGMVIALIMAFIVNKALGLKGLGIMVLIIILTFGFPLIYFSYKKAKNAGQTDSTGVEGTGSPEEPVAGAGRTDSPKEPGTGAGETDSPEEPVTGVVQKDVVLLENGNGLEGPQKFKWIKKNGKKIKKTKGSRYTYGTLPKCSLNIQSVSKEDSGIYQCVRNLAGKGVEKINVVLHVSDKHSVSLNVHPFHWANKSFRDQGPDDLKELLPNGNQNGIEDQESNGLKSVKWEYISGLNWEEKNEIMLEKSCSLCISSLASAGEYNCTVKLNDDTQIYFFLVHFLGPEELESETSPVHRGYNRVANSSQNEYVTGVPSVLKSRGVFGNN